MSESTLSLQVSFLEAEIAQKLENLLHDMSSQSGTPLHEYAYANDLTLGMDFFDSWWLVDKIERNGKHLSIEFIGSPSGYNEENPNRRDDAIEWLSLFGTSKITGKLVLDTGADVEVIEFT